MKQFHLSFLAIWILSCNISGTRKQHVTPEESAINVYQVDTMELFTTFNARFHSDSMFQISRIAFPIGGHSIDGFDQNDWTIKNWRFLEVPVSSTADTSEYKHSLITTDTTVVERFWIEDSGIQVERRFTLLGHKWFLTYYDDISL